MINMKWDAVDLAGKKFINFMSMIFTEALIVIALVFCCCYENQNVHHKTE